MSIVEIEKTKHERIIVYGHFKRDIVIHNYDDNSFRKFVYQ